jgi:hypothetical protein
MTTLSYINNLSVGWGVFGGGVVFGGRGGVVRFGFGVDGDTFVFDISDITVVVVSGVGHSLDTAIGKSNLVRSRDSFAVSGFLGVEVSSGVVILDSVLESVWFWGFIVMRSGGGGMVWGRGVIRGWRSSGESHRYSHEGSDNGKTEHD